MKGRTPHLAAALLLLLAAGAWVQRGDPPVAAVARAGRDPQIEASRPPDTVAGLQAAYTLGWWTVDGGGTSYGRGGDYALGGTAGQPDAAAPRSAGSYTLRAGFWLPSCTAAVVSPAIAAAGNTVTLTWTPVAANQAYQVHRANTPYFAASGGTLQTLVTALPWSFTDPQLVIGDPTTNYFYLLRAACGAAYADSTGRVGEFDFALVPGS